MTEKKPDKVIDTRGLKCPLPLLRAKQSLNEMISGQTLYVIANDKTTMLTFPAYLSRSGDKLIKMDEDGADVHHFIQKI